MKFEPRFYSNPDNNHCLQASIMMVLNSLGCNTSWQEVDRLTEYDANYWSWSIKGALVISEKVVGTKFVSKVDYQQFANRGEEYFREINANNPDWFQCQKQHASPNFIKEQNHAKEFLNSPETSFIKASLGKSDIERYLTDNLLVALLDVGILTNGINTGHYVVVYLQNKSTFTLHDPGQPPRKGLTVQKSNFMRAFKHDTIIVPKGTRAYGMEVERNDPCPCGSGKKFKHCCL